MNFEFHHEASDELRAAIAFYETQQTGLGRDFWEEIIATLKRIELNPEGPERISPSLQRTSVRRFPYGIFYGIRFEVLWVVAIAHHSRQAGYWKGRIHER